VHPKKQVGEDVISKAADPGGSTEEASTKRSPWPGGRGDEWEGSYVDREGALLEGSEAGCSCRVSRLTPPWKPEALVDLIDYLCYTPQRIRELLKRLEDEDIEKRELG
jgi:hypothetical protein